MGLAFALKPSMHHLNNSIVHIVIARYHENMSSMQWVLDYPHTVYNRGNDEIPEAFNTIEALENVGRESFIYLKHIVRHYHNFMVSNRFKVTVFMQADVQNNAYIIDIIKGLATGQKNFSNLHDGFAYLPFGCIPSDDQAFHTDFLYLKDSYSLDECKDRVSGNITKRKLTAQEGVKLLIKILYNFDGIRIPRFTPTGLFAVTNYAIIRNSKMYYARLARELGIENRPRLGYFFERTWAAVFHSKCLLSKSYYCNWDVNNTCCDNCDWSYKYTKCDS